MRVTALFYTCMIRRHNSHSRADNALALDLLIGSDSQSHLGHILRDSYWCLLNPDVSHGRTSVKKEETARFSLYPGLM